MVAKTLRIQNRIATSVNPIHVRETVQKVERCMARLQELQFTVTGGVKIISGVKLSPRSTRGYLRTSLRCKQESMRNAAFQRSPALKIPETEEAEEWRRMSLPAMLLSKTVAEILQASKTVASFNPRTPDTGCRSKKPLSENSALRARRAKEKQNTSRTIRAESSSPILHRARSRISFKAASPVNKRYAMNINGARPSISVNRMSPKNRPWARKTVLFPNPLFLSTSPTSTHQKKFFKTRSPIIAQRTPHKFLIKSPPTTLGSLGSLFQSKKAVPAVAASGTKIKGMDSKPQRCSFSPSKLANRLVSPLKTRLFLQEGGRRGLTMCSQFKCKKEVPSVGFSTAKIKGFPSTPRRCSFSPSKFANRLVSPLKIRLSLQEGRRDLTNKLKQRPGGFNTAMKMSSTLV